MMLSLTKPLSCLAIPLLVASPLLAQNPWSRVPAYPTGCYYEADTFDKDVETVRSSLLEETDRQRGINQGIQLKYTDMDINDKQARLMAFMQKNPTGAQKIMQQMQAMETRAAAGDPGTIAGEAELLTQLKQAREAYATELAQVVAPLHKAIQEQPENVRFSPAVKAATDRFNGANPAVCKKWLSPARLPNGSREGRIVALLDSYQEVLMDEYIPMMEQNQMANKEFLVAMGIPVTGLAPTAAMEAVYKFLGEAQSAYGKREDKPRVVQ